MDSKTHLESRCCLHAILIAKYGSLAAVGMVAMVVAAVVTVAVVTVAMVVAAVVTVAVAVPSMAAGPETLVGDTKSINSTHAKHMRA